VIVVVGSPRARLAEPGSVVAAGLAAHVALAAAAAGAPVQIVGRVGEDAPGEGALLDLAQRGVGHVAVLRDPARATPIDQPNATSADADADAVVDGLDAEDPVIAPLDAPSIDAADLELALRYLPDYRVIVIAEPIAADVLRVAASAVGWSGSALVVVGDASDSTGMPDEVTVFARPDSDPDGAFAAMVGTYAAGLDRGDDPREAFTAATVAVGSTAAPE
jgi:hypothetical protein